MLNHLDCTKCEKRYEPGQTLNLCECGAPLYARYDLERAKHDMRPGQLALREPTMWRYHEVLPLADPEERVSLGEGFTPLLPATGLGELLGLPRAAVTTDIVVVDVEGRMVDQQDRRLVRYACELRVQPCLPRLAVDAFSLSCGRGIEGDQAQGRGLDSVVEKVAGLRQVALVVEGGP